MLAHRKGTKRREDQRSVRTQQLILCNKSRYQGQIPEYHTVEFTKEIIMVTVLAERKRKKFRDRIKSSVKRQKPIHYKKAKIKAKLQETSVD